MITSLLSLVYDHMNLKLLEDEIEIDESFLFREKKSKAYRRRHKPRSQWLFGMKKRGSLDFVVVPVQKRDEITLNSLILKHINISSTIYSDSYSVYVNNFSFPKTSKLIPYGYAHIFVNHKIEFVSAFFKSCHTNTVERLWLEIKTYLKKMRCTSKYMYSIYRYYYIKNLSKELQFTILVKALHNQQVMWPEDQ